MAEGSLGYGEAAPGDHLQTSYNLWLVGHQLEHGRAPWRDPYSFQPEVKPRWNLAGWPFGFVYWPLQAATRDRARVERASSCSASSAPGGFTALVAPGGRHATWSGARRRARVRDGAVPPGAVERGPPAARGSRCSCRCLCTALERARKGSEWWLFRGRRGARLDPALGQLHSCARSDPVLRRVRARPIALGRAPGRPRARRRTARGRARRRAARPVPADASSGRSSTTRRASRTSSRGTRTRSKESSTSAGRSRCSPSQGSSRSSCGAAGAWRSCSASAR